MANQYVNKVVVNNEIKMDLTEDTITPNTLRKGFTAHDASGAPIVGNESLTDISDGTTAGPILELTAEGWAEQDTLSGKNLLPNTASGTQTINGVTFTVNPDKSITCTGTATADTYFELAPVNTVLGYLASDTTYLMSGVTNGSASTYQLLMRTASTDKQDVTTGGNETKTSASTSFRSTGNKVINRAAIIVYSGATVDTTIYPQLELGNTATDYEPYCGAAPSPSPDYPQEIRVARGRNLLEGGAKIDKSKVPFSNSSAGVSTTDIYDGEPLVSVTANTSWIRVDLPSLKAGEDYVLSFDASRGSYGNLQIIALYGSTTYTFADGATGGRWNRCNIAFTAISVTYVLIGCAVNAGFYMRNVQLERGSVGHPYVQYGNYVGVEVYGRNLLKPSSVKTAEGITWTVNNLGQTVANGTATANSPSIIFMNGETLKAGTYTLSNPSSEESYVAVYNITSGTPVPISYANQGQARTFTLSSDAIIHCRYFVYQSHGAYSNFVITAQLECGSVAHSYEPYLHTTIPIPLPEKGWVGALPDGTTDILKLDGAGGYEWESKTKELVFDGTTVKTNGAVDTGANVKRYYHILSEDTIFVDNNTLPNAYSTHFVQYTPNQSWGTTDNCMSIAGDGKQLVFINAVIDTSVSNAFNTWLQSNPVTVIYPLATPTIEQGYVNEWNNDFLLGCTIDIPELRNINAEYFLYDSITQLADDYYDRTTNDISEAMSQTADSATLEALAAIAPIENDISSANYPVGSYLIHDGKLCQVTQAIAANEAITVGTNVVLTNVGNELDELNDAVDEINANPYILPTMSESEKGGAKVGEGLSVSNDILNVDMFSTDPNDAGPLLSLQAEGWAEQTQYTGKNLLHHDLYSSLTERGVTLTKVDSTTQRFVGTTSSTGDLWVCPMANYFTTAGTYTFSITSDDTIPSAFRPQLAVHRVSDNAWLRNAQGATGTKSVTFTLAEGERVNVLGFIIGSSGVAIDATIHFQIESGSTATSYEPYCGGVPSPNPDYPQEIRVARGRNLWSLASLYSRDSIGDLFSRTDMPVASGTYTLSFDVDSYTIGGTNDRVQLLTYDSELAGTGSVVISLSNGRVSGTFNVREGAQSLKIYAGTPCSISNIQLEKGSVATPYVPYGYIGMEVHGKNLLDMATTYFHSAAQGSTGSSSKNGNTVNVTTTVMNGNNGYIGRLTSLTFLQLNTDYAISFDAMATTDNVLLNVDLGDGAATTFTVGMMKKRYSMTSQLNSVSYKWLDFMNRSVGNITITNIQIEEGTEAHRYHPYFAPITIPIPLPSKGFVAALPDGTSDILRLDGAGGYEWTLNVGEGVLNGRSDEQWLSSGDYKSTSGGYYACENYASINGLKLTTSTDVNNVYVSNLSLVTLGATIDNHGSIGYFFPGTPSGVIRVRMYESTEAQDIVVFKTWIAQHPITILSALATPTTEQGYLDNWDNCIPIHATIDIPELRNIGVECYLNEESARINAQWSKRLKAADDISASNAATESLASLAPVEGDISSSNYTVGSYLIHNNQLCKVTVAIATNEAITEDSNITPVTLSDDVKYLIDNPYILPTMSESTKGGAKVGYGLSVENDILSVGGMDDPNDAGPIVKLNANGWAEQFSTTGKNLLPNFQSNTVTINGITFSRNADGSVHVSGTATANAFCTIIPLANNYKLPSGTLSILPQNSNKYCVLVDLYNDSTRVKQDFLHTLGTKTADSSQYTFNKIVSNLIVYNGMTVNDDIYPQVELGSTATSYEPYTGGAPSPSPDYPQEIKVCRGRNLFDPLLTIHDAFLYYSGTPYKVTAFEGATIYVAKVKRNTTYTISSRNSDRYAVGGFTTSNIQVNDTYTLIDSSFISDVHTFNSGNFDYIGVYLYSTAKFGQESSVQLEEGSTAHPYVPYGHVGVDVSCAQSLYKDNVYYDNDPTEKSNSNMNIRSFIANEGTYLLRVTGNASLGGSTSARIHAFDSDGNWLKHIISTSGVTANNSITIEIITPARTAEVRVAVNKNTMLSLMQTIPIPLPERGYVASLPDGTSDILTLDGAGRYEWEMKTDEVVFDGDETFTKTANVYAYYSHVLSLRGADVANNLLSTHFRFSSTNGPGSMGNMTFIGNFDSGTTIRNGNVTFRNDSTTTLADWTTWLQSNPITVLYPLATPQTESGYIDYDNTIPVHATISSADLEGIEIRCVADSGAAEISAAWGKRIENELNSLREIVNTLLANS